MRRVRRGRRSSPPPRAGVTGRPRADALRQRSTPSGHASSSPSRSTSPGATATTRMPRAPSSAAAAAVRWCRAALATAYGAWVGVGRSPSIEPDDHDDPAGAQPGGGPVQQGGRGAQAGAVEGVPGGRVEGVPLDVVLREGVEHDDVGGARPRRCSGRGGRRTRHPARWRRRRRGRRAGRRPGIRPASTSATAAGGTVGVPAVVHARRRGRARRGRARRPGPARRWPR